MMLGKGHKNSKLFRKILYTDVKKRSVTYYVIKTLIRDLPNLKSNFNQEYTIWLVLNKLI